MFTATVATDREGRERMLLQQIDKTPGANLRQLQRYTGIPLATTARLLDTLEADGRVRVEERRSYRLFFPAGTGLHARERTALGFVGKVRPRALLETILDNPGIGQGELAAAVGLPAPTVTYYVKQLVAADLVLVRKSGVQRFYRIKNPALLRKALERTRRGFTAELA